MKHYVGIDVGGTNVKFGMFSSEGELEKKWAIKTDSGDEGRRMWRQISDSVRKNVSANRLAGIGIGIPGPVLENGFVEVCVNLGLHNFNPVAILRENFPAVRVSAANDANMAALGEQWKGSGRGFKTLGMITLGTGVGGGIILDGKIVYGANGLSGEFGHIQFNPDETENCTCGGRGCINQIASATGIARYAKKMLRNDPGNSALRAVKNLNAKDVIDAAKRGDVLAESTLRFCMDYLAKGIAAISYVVDPEVFVIGGGVSNAGDYLIRMIQKCYDPYITLSKKKAKVIKASLGNDAGIFGAARLAMQEEEEDEGREH